MGRKHSKHKDINKKNIKTAGIVLIIGLLVMALLYIKNGRAESDDNVLVREENGKNQNVKLVAQSDYGEESIEMELLSRTYSEEEIESIKESFLDELKLRILAGNVSFDEITSDIGLPESIEGYPFEVSYRIRPRGFVGSDGKITEEIEEETPLEIEFTYSLDDFEEKGTVECILIPKEKSARDAFYEKIRKYLDNENESKRTDKNIVLPKSMDGTEITWSRKKNSRIPAVAALTALCVLIILFKDRFLEEENEKKRREKLILEYPDFAVKYALLNEAGLTHRQVIERLGSEFEGNRRGSPIYEEIHKVSADVKGGISLSEALDDMAGRCGVREITFFVGLINRNIKKGGREIAAELRKAADESSSEKREKVRRKAETAGTRLLIPMVFLLIIVFALIMIPAFDSFSF